MGYQLKLSFCWSWYPPYFHVSIPLASGYSSDFHEYAVERPVNFDGFFARMGSGNPGGSNNAINHAINQPWLGISMVNLWLIMVNNWNNNISGGWFGTCFIFPYIGNNHPNWLIFFRGIETTNQIPVWEYPSYLSMISGVTL